MVAKTFFRHAIRLVLGLFMTCASTWAASSDPLFAEYEANIKNPYVLHLRSALNVLAQAPSVMACTDAGLRGVSKVACAEVFIAAKAIASTPFFEPTSAVTPAGEEHRIEV